ncbi:hypothetical protein CERZMDRAFT_46601 [Cercospora zeae-maydis SCOH1-5]|uniref:Uncharacterized protein n=1 Tax=Cercospora zeae-maydis SCOH1-5 TaxID=717836 RepID=A0A6A6F8S6_9PEZI|nr:hypothetical protein CERZMDRAFT_46601 [Cercospora zeae-maydis SCOH1-5]
MPHIVLLGTCDTKLQELLYLRSQILSFDSSSLSSSNTNNTKVTLVDVGRSPTHNEFITITQETLTSQHHSSPSSPSKENLDPSTLPRGDVIKYMTLCASNWLRTAYQRGLEDPEHALHAIISAGGTGGTALASAVMRDVLPIGFPKFIVSTAASGDTGPIVGECDIALIYSVVDIAGRNEVLDRVLGNAAGGVWGMGRAYQKKVDEEREKDGRGKRKIRLGITMFGVTTPGVDKIRSHLETISSTSAYDFEPFIFHCTGHGGLAMERLVAQNSLDAIIDLTTTEVCDLVAGGVMSAGPRRLEAALHKGIPCIISLGATDMVNFGPKETVPERYTKMGQERLLYEHNPTVTLMRTSVEECRMVGEFIADKVRRFAKHREMVKVVLPLGGVSMLSTSGGPFWDVEADEALFGAVRDGLKGCGVEVVEDERDVNDEGFARDVAARLLGLLGL